MTVTVLKPHGFCMGVKAAIEAVLRALDDSAPPVFCLHELVHNPSVVAELAKKGVRFVQSVEEIPVGGTVVFSAHGVSPEVRRAVERRGLCAVDATCPFVARVHRQVRAFAERRVPVVVIGHAGHVEVEGVAGEARHAGGDVCVVRGAAEVARLPFAETEAVGVVSQTTLSVEEVEETLRALRGRYPRLETTSASAVCTATSDRQEAVRAFVARGGDGVVVLGGEGSSNTRRLAELAERHGARVWRVANPDEFSRCDFAGVTELGVTSGASTPEDFFDFVVGELRNRRGDG